MKKKRNVADNHPNVFLGRAAIILGGFLLFSSLTLGFMFDFSVRHVAAVGGPFKLVSHNSQVVSDEDYLGRPYLVFFGYTHCQDVCPMMLFQVSEALRSLGPDANISVIFVTVDPERDNPAILKDYLANFDPRIDGLSGERPAINQMLKSFHIYSKNVPLKNNDYAINHTTVVYLMNKLGEFVGTLDVSGRADDTAALLRKYL
jgi:protein SCO1/2